VTATEIPLVILAAGRAKRYGGGLKPLAPVGPHDEAMIDLLASDALAAGFSRFVVVVNPVSGPHITDHLSRNWPSFVEVCSMVQPEPRGTVDAVLAAYPALDGVRNFGVANADDLYGETAFSLILKHLTSEPATNALVAFQLDRAVVGQSVVTRAVCHVGPNGHLVALDERRGVRRRPDGWFETADGHSPHLLEPTTLVSMNLWGLQASLRNELQAAMDSAIEGEVLLPELVGKLVQRTEGPSFLVLPTDGHCIGVTHPDDLGLVRAAVAAQISGGERSAKLWPDF
jgi:hypothetical protein